MNFANQALRNLFYGLAAGEPNEGANRYRIDQFFDTYEVAISLRTRVDQQNSADSAGGAMPIPGIEGIS